MKKRETVDLAILIAYPIIAALLCLLLRVNLLGSVIIFLVLPSIYLSLRARQHVKKALLFSAVVSVPLYILVDYIGHLGQQWLIADSSFPYRLFGYVTFDAILWAFFTCYFTLLFYEYFLDKHVTKQLWHPRMKYVVVVLFAIYAIFFVLYVLAPGALRIPYFYFWFGLLALLLPVVVQLWNHPRMSAKFFKAGAYFFFFSFIYELTAVKLGWWTYPGEFIGWVEIAGLKFPFEELFFWIMLLTLAGLSYYEFFENGEHETT